MLILIKFLIFRWYFNT